MIADPQNDFERIENAMATQIEVQTVFQGIKNPDGSPWTVITEDEGDVETIFEQRIQVCGLAVVVQTPTARSTARTQSIPGPRFDPLICPVQISENVLFNRSTAGTQVRIQTAASVIRRCIHLFTATGINGLRAPFIFIEALRDRDRLRSGTSELGDLVASVVCLFHVVLNEESLSIQ